MIGKLKDQFTAWRAERRAAATARALHSEHGHGRFFLLHVPAAATICAAVVEWYWSILFCIEATGRIDWNYETAFGTEQASASIWNFAFSTHWPVFLGLVCATVPIVMLSMVWLPVQFAMRGTGRWRRGTVILVGILANILVIVSGTVVMNYNRQEQVREALVVEQTAQANRGAIQAQIDAVNDDLARLTDRRINNEYAATAANVGADAYRAQYMSEEALARSPAARRDIIVRALGAAERADALRAERAALFQQLAQAPTEAAVAANVEDTVGRELNQFAQVVEVWRPPFVAVICTLIGIFGAWWVLALLQGLNPRDVMRSGWADESHRIPDMRDEEAIVPQPMEPHREVVTDAETGEELVKVKPREYWRRRGARKGKATKVEVQPEPQPDEQGVQYDGGGRMGSVVAPVLHDKIGADAHDQHPSEGTQSPNAGSLSVDDNADAGGDNQNSESQQRVDQDLPSELPSELPDLTDDELLEAEQSADEQAVDEQQAEDKQHGEAEAEPEAAVIDPHHEPRTEPETDERRLIAAE